MVRTTAYSESHILETAKKHFVEFGFAGARMQAIADEAGTNKALLHYYFKSKEQLFHTVWKEEGKKIQANVEKIVTSDMPILSKIRKLVENDIEHLLHNRDIPLFMMREMSRDPDLIKKNPTLKDSDKLFKQLFTEIEAAQKNGIIRKDIEPKDIFINMSSLTMFPFVAKPFCSSVFHIQNSNYEKWLAQRKKKVADFIIKAIQQ